MRGDIKIDPILRAAIERALMYYDHGELPRGWQVDLTENAPSSSDEEESVDEEIKPTPDEDMFLSKLYALMEEQGQFSFFNLDSSYTILYFQQLP